VGMTRITASLRRAARLAFGAKARLVQMERPIAAIYQRTARAAPRIARIRRPADRPGSRSAHAQCQRLLDCNPLSGGDRIIWWKTTSSGTVISMCTLGFPWTPRGTRHGEHTAVTAGHCAPPTGISWYQGYYDSRHNVINVAHKLGPPSKVSFGANRADAEVIKARKNIIFWAFTWINSSPFPLNQIRKYAGVMQGERICANGSFTGENCHGKVKATNVCVKEKLGNKTIRVCDLAYATASTRLGRPGDSGGPVYDYIRRPTGGNAGEIRLNGIIDAGNPSGTQLYFANMQGLEHVLDGHPTTQ
jgi:hypothetical protein